MARTVESFRTAFNELVRKHPNPQPVVGLVPTMGALHSGHAALIDAARDHADIVIASVFVNPLQFDDDSDFQHYPRDLESDAALLGERGVQLVFAPELEEMYPGYPQSPQIRVSTGEMGRMWEGASRAGHFDGVATVVTKLFSIMAPPHPARLEAWFGQKDAEQLAIIRRLTADLNLPVCIRAVRIVRDENGLALSSRNQRLSQEEYWQALHLNRALFALREAARAGRPLPLEQVTQELRVAAGVELDYLVAVDPQTLRQVPGVVEQPLEQEVLALIAARVGPVRLIDNLTLQPAD